VTGVQTCSLTICKIHYLSPPPFLEMAEGGGDILSEMS